jgi:predicted porin
MKKSVLALAVLGAFAGAASAQSSVTLLGVVDVNMRYVNNDDAAYLLSQDCMSSSRLGFRGVEDLGGGLKASFWLEGALGPDTGTGTSSYGNGNSSTSFYQFRRRSTVSLSNAWGELRLGRDYTPTFWNWTVFDPFGTNGIGSATNLVLGAELRSATSAGDAFGTLVRANNMVQYVLPNGTFGPGLYGQVSVAAGESAALNKFWGGRIGYAAGPFDVAASYGWTAVDSADTLAMTNWNVAGSWNFGSFGKLSGFYGQIDVDLPAALATQLVGATATSQNWYIGYVIPFGQYNFKLSYGGVNQGGNRAFEGNDATQWALGADYNLSKRTALYATVASLNNNNSGTNTAAAGRPVNGSVGTAYSINGGATPLGRGESSTGFEIGVRHSF